MAQEIRCLPNDHDAKLKMFEVRSMIHSLKVVSAAQVLLWFLLDLRVPVHSISNSSIPLKSKFLLYQPF